MDQEQKEKKKETFIKTYTLGDLFDHTLKMVTHVWKNGLFFAAISAVPMALSMWYFWGNFIKQIDFLVMIESMEEPPLAALSGMLFFYLKFVGITVISGLIGVIAYSGLSYTVYKCAHGEKPGFMETLNYIIKEKFVKLFLQSLLVAGIITGATVIITALAVILGLAGTSGTLFGILYSVLVIAFTVAAIWAAYRFYFCQTAIVLEDESVTGGLARSFRLTAGKWWRVFGFTFIFGITLFFANSIITAPVSIAFSTSSSYMDILNGLLMSEEIDLSFTYSLFSHMTIPMVIGTLISSFVTGLIMPIFQTLLFIDLQTRKAAPKEEGIQ